MEEKKSRPNLKRPLPDDCDDDDSNKHVQKRVRFPKGKKIKPGTEKVDVWKPSEEEIAEKNETRKAVKERSLRRIQISPDLLREESLGVLPNISAAEQQYEENEKFVDDGITMEPFNLEQEREEGYFDEQGNYVEYVNENEIKDAWLDSVQVNHKLADKDYLLKNDEDDESNELSSEDVGIMKRRIADVLEPGETVLRALKRLKGNSNNRKEKMSASTKEIFDQLTEDAMKLMENGDYNVYDEKQEVFQREAEGYEKLAHARGESTSFNPSQEKMDSEILSKNEDAFDMFAADDEDEGVKPTAEDGSSRTDQPSESGDQTNDYAYDESSGYYYSSSSGYYYDPSSALYCSAASGQWYCYNEAAGTYDEVQSVLEPASNVS